MLRTQIHIYELGKYESPGSREDEFAIKFCRAQYKIKGSRFGGATQIAVSSALISLFDERAENRILLTLNMAATKIVQAFVQMN
jgi:hypothetical protein